MNSKRNSMEIKEKSISENTNTNTNNYFNNSNHLKNNSFKFSFYSYRRDPFSSNKDKVPIVSYLNPKEDLSTNGVSLFSKGSNAKRDIFRNSIVPAGADYRPNFESISKKPVVDVKFSGNFGRLENGKKKKNVKKIFCSYDVHSQFKSVDMNYEIKKYWADDAPILID